MVEGIAPVRTASDDAFSKDEKPMVAATPVPEVEFQTSDGEEQDSALLAALNHRKLNARQIQLTSIAGSVGAALFVGIGSGVMSGPLCLLIAFVFWATVVYVIAQCQMEIVTVYPLDGSFIRLAGRMVDPALGVFVGWNHFLAQTSYVIFEATVINTLVEYWGYDKSPAILITASLIFFLCINIYRADLFGEAEFWLALGKVFLATGLIIYTFIAMLGGNPLHDRFGFRYWKEPGVWNAPTGSMGLRSFINAVNVAGFCMIAGEAKDPRRTMPRAFRTIMARLIFFFIGGAICVGVLVPYNDETLTNGAATYSGASPYVISMTRLQIPVLPSIVTAALITTIFSAGEAYTFGASRSLHALSLEGKAPRVFRRLNKHGVPYTSVIAVIVLSSLSYLALGSSSARVLNWILNFCTAATMVNWSTMAFTYIRFQAGMKAQGLSREEFLPVKSKVAPYACYYALFWAFLWMWIQGYGVFIKGNWDVATLIFNYGLIFVAGAIALGWKIIKKTKFQRASEIDLHSGLEHFEKLTEYYRNEREGKPVKLSDKIMAKIF